jgi:predicted membrane protein
MNNLFLALDKLFILLLFLGMSYFESTKYLFHVFAIVIIGSLNHIIFNMDLRLFMSFFTISFGLINIIKYSYSSSIYNFVLVFVSLILLRRSRYSTRGLLIMNAVGGIAIAILYTILLHLLGYNLKNQSSNEENEDVCVEYDGDNNFIKYL